MAETAPTCWDTSLFYSCLQWDRPGVIAFKNSHTPVYQNQRKKKISLPPKPKYIYICIYILFL